MTLVCSPSLFNSPPHPASAFPPLLPLPSSGFVCSPRGSQVFSCTAPCSAEPTAQLKPLFRSDSGTAYGWLPLAALHNMPIGAADTYLRHGAAHNNQIPTHAAVRHTHTHTRSLFLCHPTITQQTLLPQCGGTMVG